MSRVVSLRLDESDPNEAAALAILDNLIAGGHSVRDIFTRVMLYAEGIELTLPPDPAADAIAVLAETRAALAEAQRLIDGLQRVGTVSAPPTPDTNGATPISDELRMSVRKAAKPGRRLE